MRPSRRARADGRTRSAAEVRRRDRQPQVTAGTPSADRTTQIQTQIPDTNPARGEITAPRRFVLYYPCPGEGMS